MPHHRYISISVAHRLPQQLFIINPLVKERSFPLKISTFFCAVTVFFNLFQPVNKVKASFETLNSEECSNANAGKYGPKQFRILILFTQ